MSILKKNWTAKHQDQVPGGILLVVEVESLSATYQRDAALTLLDRVRANVVVSGRTGLPVALAIITPNEESGEEKNAYVAFMKKAAVAPPVPGQGPQQMISLAARDNVVLRTSPTSFQHIPPCALVVLSKLDLEKETDLVQKFRNQLLEAVREWYRTETAKIKAYKRGEPKRSGGLALKARHEFKIAQYYEMRSTPNKALIHYQESYQALVSLAMFWTESATSEYAAHEIRSAAEIVHYRTCSLRLEAGDARQALGQLRLHLKTMSALFDPAYDHDEFWEWMSRQHVLFAGLLSANPSGALSVAYGALDACERERLSSAYHLSRAARYAKNLSKPNRALDLLERLVDANARKRKNFARREAALLVSISEERNRSGDFSGAQRDLERAAAMFCQDGWFDLYLRFLRKLDHQFVKRSRLPTTMNIVEAQYVARFDRDETRVNEACEFLTGNVLGDRGVELLIPILSETALIEVEVDEDGKHARLRSCFPKDVKLKAILSSDDEHDELDVKSLFGLTKVVDFTSSHESALQVWKANSDLVLDLPVLPNNKSVRDAQALYLVLESDCKWKCSFRVESRAFAEKRHLLQKRELHASSNGVVLFGSSGSGGTPKRTDILISGLPGLHDYAFVGETLTVSLNCVVFSPRGGNGGGGGGDGKMYTTPTSSYECECNVPWVRVHASNVLGQFDFEIVQNDLEIGHAISASALPVQVSISAYDGSSLIATKQLEFSVVWPLRMGLYKRAGDVIKPIVEIESSAAPMRVLESKQGIDTFSGEWTAHEKKSAFLDSMQSLDFVLARMQDGNLQSKPWLVTVPLPDALLNELNATIITLNNTIVLNQTAQSTSPTMAAVGVANASDLDQVQLDVVFCIQEPFIQFGQIVPMQVILQRPFVSDDAHDVVKVSVVSEPCPGFFRQGLDQVDVSLFPGERVVLGWTLVAVQLGPHRLPGVWIDLAQERSDDLDGPTNSAMVSAKRKRIESPDSLCLVLPVGRSG